ncbi:MAG: YabP/YqfC family sporulation protein [Bacilli bacterium]|nr:YabP/YqfC family sporulation protein [Bacilli bacterium]
MNIKKIINDYVECNEFEIKIINGKVKIYYYDKIEHFSNSKIIVSKNDQKVSVEGKGLVIETMFEELVVIAGDVSQIILGKQNE